MDEESLSEEPQEELEEIPPLLHSLYEEGPFRKCSICERPLLEGETLYEIQKIWRGRETVFEYAICQPCGMELVKSYSKESLDRIREFFESRFQPDGEEARGHFCRREARPGRDDLSMMAMCMGAFLLAPPVVICDPCNESLNEKLSKKTRESYGDFIDTHFPGVPVEWEVPTVPLGF